MSPTPVGRKATSPHPAACSIQNQRTRPLLAKPCEANASRAKSMSNADVMSLTSVRVYPRGREAHATASTAVRKPAAHISRFGWFAEFKVPGLVNAQS